jgi:hypothetical protein
MLAVLFDKFAVGVKTAVRVRPDPVIALKVPPKTVRSPEVPFHSKLNPGSSEKVKVIVAVSPIFSTATFEVIATVGPRILIRIEGDEPPEPVLPAASE